MNLKRPRKVYAVILDFASRVKTFTPRNLQPALTPHQAESGCLALAKLGELELVKPGKRGNGGVAAVFRLAANMKLGCTL